LDGIPHSKRFQACDSRVYLKRVVSVA
jgi:hypothetical protein